MRGLAMATNPCHAPPTFRTREARHLAGVFMHERERFAANANDAKALVDGIKAIRIDSDLDRVEIAAWFCVATILLNLDETISKG